MTHDNRIFKDGVVDWEEWRKDLKMRGVPDSEIEAVFAKYDQDGDMMLNAEEQQKLKEDLLKQAEQINKDIEVSLIPTSFRFRLNHKSNFTLISSQFDLTPFN